MLSNTFKKLCGVVLVTGLAFACTQQECTILTDPQLRLRFVIQVERADARGVRTTLLLDTAIRIIRVTGIGNTSGRPVSQVANDTVEATSLALLLPQTVDSAAFVIVYDTARLFRDRSPRSVFTDTLRVRYNRRAYFVSEGCGFNYKFDNLEITRQSFTTSPSRLVRAVTVDNPTVDEVPQSNITFLFVRRPRPR